MTRITYRVNGGKYTDTLHCEIVTEKDNALIVLINGELEYRIPKNKIVENISIDNDKNKD